MKKIENIINILKFYMAVNKLKKQLKEKAVVPIMFLEVLS